MNTAHPKISLLMGAKLEAEIQPEILKAAHRASLPELNALFAGIENPAFGGQL